MKNNAKNRIDTLKHPLEQLGFDVQSSDFLERFHESFLGEIQGAYIHIKKEFLKHEADEVQGARDIVHEIRAIENWFRMKEFMGDNIEKKLSPITSILEELNRSDI